MLENRVKELRTERGLRQGDLAEKMNVSQQTISRIQPYRKWGKCSAIGYIDSFIKIFSCVNGLHIKAIGRENDTGISFGNGTDVIKTL